MLEPQHGVSFQLVGSGYWELAARSNNFAVVDIGLVLEGNHGEGILVGV